MRQEVPRPGVLSTEIAPPSMATCSCNAAIPIPRPEVSVTSDRVVNPGLKSACKSSRGSRCGSFRSMATDRTRSQVDAGTVVGDHHDEVAMLGARDE